MKRLMLTMAAVLALAGCGGPHNTDPIKGKVTLDESGCFWGDCYELYEVCVGPDLRIVYDEMGDDDYAKVLENSPECEGAVR